MHLLPFALRKQSYRIYDYVNLFCITAFEHLVQKFLASFLFITRNLKEK